MGFTRSHVATVMRFTLGGHKGKVGIKFKKTTAINKIKINWQGIYI